MAKLPVSGYLKIRPETFKIPTPPSWDYYLDILGRRVVEGLQIEGKQDANNKCPSPVNQQKLIPEDDSYKNVTVFEPESGIINDGATKAVPPVHVHQSNDDVVTVELPGNSAVFLIITVRLFIRKLYLSRRFRVGDTADAGRPTVRLLEVGAVCFRLAAVHLRPAE